MKKSQNVVTLIVIAGCCPVQYRPGPFSGKRYKVFRDGSTTGGGKMKKSVDIFWFGESGPVWVEAAQTMERAKACIDASPRRRLRLRAGTR
jgi:hypothetical protein